MLNEHIRDLLIFHQEQVIIELYKPLREFTIIGNIVTFEDSKSFMIKNNKVKLSDKLCIRFNIYKDDIDVEVYGKGRDCWYQLTKEQYSNIKDNIQLLKNGL